MNPQNLTKAHVAFIKNYSGYHFPNDDELLQRRRKKRFILNLLVLIKFITRGFEDAFNKGQIQKAEYEKQRLSWGRFALTVLCDMRKMGIKLTEAEHRSLFNIPAKVWRENQNPKKPSGVMHSVFLSAEPLAIYTVYAMSFELGKMERRWLH